MWRGSVAHGSAVDKLFDPEVERIKVQVICLHVRDAGLINGSNDPLGIRQGGRHRLLHHDVLSGSCGWYGVIGVLHVLRTRS